MTTVTEERHLAAPATVPTAAASPNSAARAVAAMPNEFLSFRLGAEEYGIDILRVQEIRSYEAPTRIANAPDFIKGVDAGYIMGMGCIKIGEVERMLILTDIEALMSSADMGLTDATIH